MLDRIREGQFVVSHNSDCIAAYRRVVRTRSLERIFENIYLSPRPCLEVDVPGANSGLKLQFGREQVIFNDIALAVDDDLRGVQQTLEGELLIRSLVRGTIPPQGRSDWMETRKRIYNIASYSEQLRNALDTIKKLTEAMGSDDALDADEISKLTTRFKTIRETWEGIEKEANLANFLADKK
jgi:hypothetical protein